MEEKGAFEQMMNIIIENHNHVNDSLRALMGINQTLQACVKELGVRVETLRSLYDIEKSRRSALEAKFESLKKRMDDRDAFIG